MKQSDTNGKDLRFMKVTASFRVDRGMTEARILAAFKVLEDVIVGSAYILHDSDTYTADEVADEQQSYDEAIAAGQTPEEAVPQIGDAKPDHYHILLAFKNQTRLSTICKAFRLDTQKEGHLINKVSNTKSYINLLAYLTHITPRAQADGKHEYSPEDVKGLIFPPFKGRESYSNCKTYNDFRAAFLSNELGNDDDYLYRVAYKGMTIREVMIKDRLYYTKHKTQIKDARQCYLALQNPPKTLFNYYVGTYEGDESGQNGGIGKSLACMMLAVSLLSQMYPDVDFEHMDEWDLVNDGYVYRAGGAGVEYQDYDGQPVVIWEDMRSYGFIKLFGGAERFFDAFDIHPKGTKVDIKYGEVKLVNKINIINGIESYDSFIDGLTEEYKRETGKWTIKEDKTQALRRVPFFFSVDPKSITFTMQLNYFFSDMSAKTYTAKNSYKTAMEHKDPYRKKHLAVYDPVVKEVKTIEDRYEKLSQEEPPEGLFEIIEPVMTLEEKAKADRKKSLQKDTVEEATAAATDDYGVITSAAADMGIDIPDREKWVAERTREYLDGRVPTFDDLDDDDDYDVFADDD